SNRNNSNSTLDLIQGPLTVVGGVINDNDSIFLNDRGNRSGQTFTITSASVSRSGMAAINYSFQKHLKVSTGGFNDVVNVRSTAAGTPGAVTLGAGDDTVNVGNQTSRGFGSTLSGIQGELDVDGEGGSDVLNLNDEEGSTVLPFPGHPYAYDVFPTR